MIRVYGRMSEKVSGEVKKMQGVALIIASVSLGGSALIISIALLIKAVH